MIDKLKLAEERYEEISRLLSESETVSDQKRYRDLMREYKALTPLIDKYREYKKASDEFEEARSELSGNVADLEYKELLKEQLENGRQ